ncbi:MAG TPA: Gfo/Idh/MocA family oxidoreductase [Verrucomicrobiota bacterium]|jgi:predicted dehydrogenase|nr:Gfo/Idh/MocA family oxidoreductase [Verrucomicrobiota bacterium]HRT07693.1 Gfo/Idh/MocA family oxidoreductase [Candidatus Paceibacterota bacterium]HRT58067.1 Gfo/Idh/MocA family oxidoreductase [Candidatus Paceibacterota bacterium]
MKTTEQIIRAGVVGCGYWGPNLIRNLRQAPDCHLKIVCDTSEPRLAHMRRLYPEVSTTRCFEDLLNDSELDAIVVATPVRFHYEMAKAALSVGKHVFIEKPMARTEAEAEELVNLAERLGLILMVGHTFLFSPAVRRMKEIIDNGDIGEVQYIAARRLNLGLFQKDINVAWDLAPHDISILLYLLDELPISVSCHGSSHVTREIEDVTMMHLGFRRNRCAFIHNSWLDPRKVREMTVVGSQRMIVYDDTQPLEKLKIYDARVEVPPHYDTFAEFTYSYHYGDAYVPYIKQDEPLKLECQHFLSCIREQSVPVANGRFGLEVVRILEAAGESLRQQGVSIPLGAVTQWSANGNGNGRQHVAGSGNGNGNGSLSLPAATRRAAA